MLHEIAAPQGFVSVTTNLGLKDEGDDFALAVSQVPAHSAAMFTQSRFAGPSIVLSRESALRGDLRGMVVTSRNANVATGERGLADAKEVRQRAADIAGVSAEKLLIASTGVIGMPYPMPVIRKGLDAISGPLPGLNAAAVATAIMTTDTHPKIAHRRCGNTIISGVAKGVGMMEPNMATLLTFFYTDADIPNS